MPRPLKGNENRPVEGLRAALQSLRQQQEPEQQQTANQKSKRHELTFKHLSHSIEFIYCLCDWMAKCSYGFCKLCICPLCLCSTSKRARLFWACDDVNFCLPNPGSSWMTVRMLQEPKVLCQNYHQKPLLFNCVYVRNDQPSWRFDSWQFTWYINHTDTPTCAVCILQLLEPNLSTFSQEQSLAAIEALLETCDTETEAPDRAPYAIKDINLFDLDGRWFF